MTTQAAVAIGSNLGSRRACLESAIACLDATPGVEVLRVSALHERRTRADLRCAPLFFSIKSSDGLASSGTPELCVPQTTQASGALKVAYKGNYIVYGTI